MPTLKKSGYRNIAAAVAKPPPECPQMPTRSRSMNGYFCRKLLHAGDLVLERVVAHVAVARVVKLLRPQRVAHAVDLDDDETEFGQRLMIAARRPRTTRLPTLPPCGPG